MDNAALMRTLYEGDPPKRLAMAHTLLARATTWCLAKADMAEAVEQVHQDALALEVHMAAMGLGRLCSQCASRQGGGCCSAYMANNTDAIQMLINLLIGIDIAATLRDNRSTECCFLGGCGCLFLIKPIFCLNYLCTHITAMATPEEMHILYRLTAAVLSGQTKVEAMLLALLRTQGVGSA